MIFGVVEACVNLSDNHDSANRDCYSIKVLSRFMHRIWVLTWGRVDIVENLNIWP